MQRRQFPSSISRSSVPPREYASRRDHDVELRIRIEPVTLNAGVYRYARRYTLDLLGRPELHIADAPAEIKQGDHLLLLGDAKADQLIGAIEHEQRMHHAPNQLIYNSMTQPRVEAAKVWRSTSFFSRKRRKVTGAPVTKGWPSTMTSALVSTFE